MAGMSGQEIWGYASAILDMNGSSDYVELWVREEGVAYGAYSTGTQFSAFRVLT